MSILTRLLNSGLHSAIICISNPVDQPHFKSCPITFFIEAYFTQGLPWWCSGKASACQYRRCEFNPWGGWGSFSGEGNGKPLQYYCLENTKNRGAWRATVQGLQSQIRLND